MSVLETQIIDESPRVVLLGHYSPFIEAMSALFAEFQLNVTKLDLAEFRQLDFSSLAKDSIYKIIWWVDLTAEAETAELTSLLKQNPQIPLVVMAVVPELFLSTIDNQQNLLNQQELLLELVTKLPQAQYFFIRDFFNSEFLPPVFKLALQGLEKKILIAATGDSYLVGLNELVQNLRTFLFKPASNNKIIIQGKAIKNEKILSYFAQLYSRIFNQELELTETDATRQKIDLGETITVTINVDEKKLIEQLVSQKEELQQQLATLPHLEKQQLKTIVKTPVYSSLNAEKTDLNTKTDEELRPTNLNNNENIEKEPIYQPKIQEALNEEKIESELSRLFKEKRTGEKEKRIDEKVKIVKKISKKSKKNKVLFGGGIGIMILGGVALALWSILELTVFFAKKDFVGYLYQNTPQHNQVYESSFWPDLLDKQASFYEKTLGEIVVNQTMVNNLLKNFRELQQLQQKFSTLTTNYTLGILGVGESSPSFPQEITDLAQEVKTKIGLVQEEIFYLAPEPTAEQQKWLDYLKEVETQTDQIQQYPEFFSKFFGGSGKRTYAVLLQNNLEIRPTGGFIQGFILLTFDKGLLIDSQVFNTNEIDGRLPGAVASPEEIQRYLGEKNWFFRDSNWDPDFPTTAQRASWFIKETFKKQVDGVIAVNYYVLQDILGAVDSLELADYQEILTKDNLLERVEFHSDDEFINTQNVQRKDYAASIYKQLLLNLKQITPEKSEKLAIALGENLVKKNLLLSVFDEKDAEFLQRMGWSGEVISPTCPQRFPQTNCLVNQIYQVETNIGLNRVNEYVDRKIEERVEFLDKKIKHIRTITYTNRAKSDGWPLGSYKLYLRFITGKNTQPKEVLVDNKKIDGSIASVYLEREKKVVGFPLEIHKDSSVTVQYVYETDKLLDEPFSYLVFDQKQPGINREDLKTTFYFPGKKPTLIAPQGNLAGDTIEFTATNNEHSFVGVSFQNK